MGDGGVPPRILNVAQSPDSFTPGKEPLILIGQLNRRLDGPQAL
jgi:hypothetical protein